MENIVAKRPEMEINSFIISDLKRNMNFFNIDVLPAFSDAFDVHDPGFELLIGHDRLIFDPGFVGINGIDRVFQNPGDFFIVGNAHPDQGEDPHVDIKQFVFL